MAWVPSTTVFVVALSKKSSYTFFHFITYSLDAGYWMIRAVVTELPPPQPVGGEIAPVSSLALQAPWISLAVIAITIGFAITRRKLFLS